MSSHWTPEVSDPFVDRITIILNLGSHQIPNTKHDSKSNQPARSVIVRFQRVAAEMKLDPIPMKIGHYGSTYLNWKLTLSKCSVIYGIRRKPNKDGGLSVRIEFNPAKLSSGSINIIESDILELLGFADGFSSLLQGATVTHLDVAVDLFGISLADLFFVGRGATGSVLRGVRTTGKQESIWSNEHGLETVYFRSGARSPSLLLRAYNKKLEQLQRHGIQPLSAAPHTRVEVAMNRRGVLLNALPSLRSPFSALGLSDVSISEPISAFADSVRTRGLDAARSRHPVESFQVWRLQTSLNSPWWDPINQWKSWPQSLLQSEIGKWISMAA